MKEQKYESEAALQDILYKSPEIIPIEKLGENLSKPRIFIKEAGLPGSGNTDLIGIDEKGSITIIECKLATNTEIRRKVIGQVFEYAAYLWQTTYDEFDNICCKAEKWTDKHLVETMEGAIKGGVDEWRGEEFVDNVTTTLEKGDFRLIIAVDALNDELKRIIQYLNSRGEGSPKIHALEMRQFASEELDLQMIVPELFGYTQKEETTPPRPPKINEKIFVGQCRQGEHNKAIELYSKAKELRESRIDRGDFMNWGVSGYSYRIPSIGTPSGNTIFVGSSNGSVTLWLHVAEKNREAGQKYIENLRHITEFRGKVGDYEKYKEPSFSTDNMTTKDIDAFMSAVDELGNMLNRETV